MPATLLTAFLLAQAPPAPISARTLYEACSLYVATHSAHRGVEGRPAEGLACENEALAQFVGIEAEALDKGGPGSVCPPDGAGTHAAGIAYIAWFELNPENQADLDGEAAFHRAMAATWPCPG